MKNIVLSNHPTIPLIKQMVLPEQLYALVLYKKIVENNFIFNHSPLFETTLFYQLNHLVLDYLDDESFDSEINLFIKSLLCCSILDKKISPATKSMDSFIIESILKEFMDCRHLSDFVSITQVIEISELLAAQEINWTIAD